VALILRSAITALSFHRIIGWAWVVVAMIIPL
jgi:hypothetical protein